VSVEEEDSTTSRDSSTSRREFVDFYELLQVSPSAEPETLHRVYRLLAQRWHPDNPRTGNVAQFHAIHEAYLVLSDAESRARYDITHEEQRQARWRVVSSELRPGSNFDMEQIIRLTVLEVLYAQRRTESNNPGIFILDLEELVGHPREHLEFTMWYLVQKRYVQRMENSRLAISVEGVDYLEANYQESGFHRRLAASNRA
jgi:curved DNA-binding protein CbpA